MGTGWVAARQLFYRREFLWPLGSSSQLRTSVVQAFDENGEGLVLRGHTFPWDDSKQGKSPHLTEEGAQQLVEMVLERYRDERNGQLPQRVVVHKTSGFEPAERRGFETALKTVHFHDLVSLRPASDVRLVRNAQYPPIRGSAFTVGDTTYLYTTGYIPDLGGYPHGHVPSPLQLADHVGDTAPDELFKEVLVTHEDELEFCELGRLDAGHASLLEVSWEKFCAKCRNRRSLR